MCRRASFRRALVVLLVVCGLLTTLGPPALAAPVGQALPPGPFVPPQGPWVYPQPPVAPMIPIVPLPLPSDPLLPLPGVREALQATGASQDPITQALVPLREAYLLLLDEYIDPLLPGNLVNAAQQRLTELLAERGVTAPDPATFGSPPPVVERASNWHWLATRLTALATQYSDKVSARELAQAAIAAMANSVNDSHTQFLSPKEYQEHLAWTRGELRYGGVGIRLRGPEPTVAQVFPNSPAANAGLQVGDVLVAVNDQPVAGLKLDEIVTRVRGPEGTAVKLRVRRAATGEEQEFTLTRAQVSVPFVESRVQGDMGYVILRGFPEPSIVEAVERAVTTLQGQGVRGLVLDLRGNAGGRLDVGTQLLGRFVGDGVVYQMVDRQGRGRTERLRGTTPIVTVPLAVLVDDGTASMGELFAATIQERGAGRLTGTTTAGSVSASVVVPLSDGSALQMTVERLLTGNGRALDKVGVTPDDTVPLSIADIQAGRDPQLDAALAYLRFAANPYVPDPNAEAARP